MDGIAIRVEGLGKRYELGAPQKKYRTFRDSFSSALTKPARVIRSLGHRNGHSKRSESIWALKDVSFEIKRGEVVGVIGRNGAGKSTLLKILSRITDPTQGIADIHGRVGSLLEVGTGFHPELTGRENTYLNGAILGMGRKEIDGKFDEIVAFAEIEKFIDTPVKHYSSGMYLRLAFAVAAHLEPEILLVDEVLAVGDESFQRKCLGKMGDVAKEGRTVLFVSHNLPAVTALCSRLFLIDQGQIVFSGLPEDGVSKYLRGIDTLGSAAGLEDAYRTGSGVIKFTSVSLTDEVFGQGRQVRCNQSCLFKIGFLNSPQLNRSLPVEFAITIKDELGRPLLTGATKFLNANFRNLPKLGTVVCAFDQLSLLPGIYRIHLWCAVGGETADLIENAGSFEVIPFDVYKSGRIPGKKHGYFVVPHSWYLEEAKPEVSPAKAINGREYAVVDRHSGAVPAE